MRFIARAAGVGMDPPADREERVRSILEVKEHIAKKIEGHEAEIEMLRRNLELLDSALTKSSFSKASDLLRASGAGRAAGGGGDAAAGTAAAPEAGRAAGTGGGKGGGGPEPIEI